MTTRASVLVSSSSSSSRACKTATARQRCGSLALSAAVLLLPGQVDGAQASSESATLTSGGPVGKSSQERGRERERERDKCVCCRRRRRRRRLRADHLTQVLRLNVKFDAEYSSPGSSSSSSRRRLLLEERKQDLVRLDLSTAMLVVSQLLGVFRKELFAFGVLTLLTYAGVYRRAARELDDYRKDLDRFRRPWTGGGGSDGDGDGDGDDDK